MYQSSNTARSSPTGAESLAANRASGRVTLAVEAGVTRMRRARVHEAGSLRVRFPNTTLERLEAVLINTAGGMAGGDDFAVKLALGPGACLVAGTAAAEKIYRSAGPDTTVSLDIQASPASRCFWLPQETILFDRARLSRRIEADLDDDASLIMAEAVVFGRSAMGEAVEEGRLVDRWRVRRGGRLIFAESIRLEGAVGAALAKPAVAAGAIAIATVLVTPAGDDVAAAVRALTDRFIGEVGVSAWNGLALARLCARDGATLRHDLTMLLTALGAPLPRLWLQ